MYSYLSIFEICCINTVNYSTTNYVIKIIFIPVTQRTFEALEDRLQRLEKDISLNQDTIQEIHGLLGRINNPIDSNVVPQFHPRIKYIFATLDE